MSASNVYVGGVTRRASGPIPSCRGVIIRPRLVIFIRSGLRRIASVAVVWADLLHANAYVAKVSVTPRSAIGAWQLGLWFAVCVTAHAPIHRIGMSAPRRSSAGRKNVVGVSVGVMVFMLVAPVGLVVGGAVTPPPMCVSKERNLWR